MGNELTDDHAREHLAIAIAELYKRGFDARGKSIAEVRRAVVAAEAEIRRAILQKRSSARARD